MSRASILIPMLCSKLLKAREVRIDENGQLIEGREKKGWYDRIVVAFLDKVDKAYANLLRWCLTHKLITILIAIAFFVASMLPMFMGKIGTEFMPSSDNGRLSASIELQRGTRIEETVKTARVLIEKYEIQKQNVAVAKRVFDNIAKKYEFGVASSLDVTNSGTNLIAAQSNYVQSLLEIVNAQISLEQLLNK